MYEKRNPKARLLLLTSSILNMIVVTVILGAIIIFAQLDEIYDKAIIGVDIFAWIIALIAPFVRYNWYRARFTDEEIDIRQGFLIIQETIIPIERLQKISLETGPLDRIFGMTKVIVYTSGGEETIRFLEKERAEQIGETLKKRINKYGQKNKTDKAEV